MGTVLPCLHTLFQTLAKQMQPCAPNSSLTAPATKGKKIHTKKTTDNLSLSLIQPEHHFDHPRYQASTDVSISMSPPDVTRSNLLLRLQQRNALPICRRPALVTLLRALSHRPQAINPGEGCTPSELISGGNKSGKQRCDDGGSDGKAVLFKQGGEHGDKYTSGGGEERGLDGRVQGMLEEFLDEGAGEGVRVRTREQGALVGVLDEVGHEGDLLGEATVGQQGQEQERRDGEWGERVQKEREEKR